MRGKDAGCLVHHEKHRITPAYAGKRCLGHLFQVELRDHPRVCGEKLDDAETGDLVHGSPPRVRGKDTRAALRARVLRITPACAGKRTGTVCCQICAQDHPRVCGEKFNCNPGSPQHWGSPPHMRGKAKIFRRWSAEMGIPPPACAGKSPASGPGCGKTGDHPRVCGEKTRYQNLKTTIQGSPPRVRGKVQPAAAGNPAERITPACAGKRIYDTVRYMGL